MHSSSTSKTSKQLQREEKIFRHFRLGLSTFFTSMALLYVIKNLLEPSIYQEILAALCILTMATGFIIAIGSEIKFIWARIIYFVRSK